MNICAPTIDARKIQGSCSGRLQQEFRELEMLDDITSYLYDGTLPVTVIGETHIRKKAICYVPPRQRYVGLPVVCSRGTVTATVDSFA